MTRASLLHILLLLAGTCAATSAYDLKGKNFLAQSACDCAGPCYVRSEMSVCDVMRSGACADAAPATYILCPPAGPDADDAPITRSRNRVIDEIDAPDGTNATATATSDPCGCREPCLNVLGSRLCYVNDHGNCPESIASNTEPVQGWRFCS